MLESIQVLSWLVGQETACKSSCVAHECCISCVDKAHANLPLLLLLGCSFLEPVFFPQQHSNLQCMSDACVQISCLLQARYCADCGLPAILCFCSRLLFPCCCAASVLHF